MKRIFLTGASSGIGLAIAHALLARGYEVWGTSRNLERLPKVSQLHPVCLDLDDPHSVEEAFNAALADAGHFDVLINNAGSGHFGPGEFLSRETIASQFQILVFAQVRLLTSLRWLAAFPFHSWRLTTLRRQRWHRLPCRFNWSYLIREFALSIFNQPTSALNLTRA